MTGELPEWRDLVFMLGLLGSAALFLGIEFGLIPW